MKVGKAYRMSRTPSPLRPMYERHPDGAVEQNERDEDVEYMLLNYDNPETREAYFAEGGDELMGEVDAPIKELAESGELVGAEARSPVSAVKTRPWCRPTSSSRRLPATSPLGMRTTRCPCCSCAANRRCRRPARARSRSAPWVD